MRITRSLVVLAAAVTVAGLIAPPASAATYDPKPRRTGAAWMAGELTGGLVHNEQYDFDDVGLSIDFALGLDAAGQRPLAVDRIANAVAANVGSYTGFPPSVYAGPTAKAAVLALSTGRNPRAFGGVDLITQLEDRVSTTAPIAGRIEDAYDPGDPFAGDFANVIGQTYAARALSLAGSSKAAAATAFLLQQQCAAGFFRQDFTADKAAPDQSCDGAAGQPSIDATALAVLSLKYVKGAQVKAAVRKAVGWLADNQRRNGSFSSKTKAKGQSNTNSTGLAGWALGVNAKAGAASRAAVWVRNLQVGGVNPCSGRLARQTGAIALDRAAYATGQSDGITKLTSDQWRRASAQALPVLRWAPRAEGAFTATAPRTAPAGSRLRIELTGVAPGQRVCVKDGQFSYEFRSGRNATRHVTFIINGDPGLRTFKVFVGSKRRDVIVKVTG